MAWKLVVLAPLAVVGLSVFMATTIPYTTLNQGLSKYYWAALARINLRLWGMLMMPLYITLQTALIAGLDHADNQWKAILARPVPRWTVYTAKLLIVAALTSVSSAILFAGMLLAGPVLNHLIPRGIHFGSPVPYGAISRQVAGMAGLAFPALTIQHWVSLRWRAFSVAVGFGIVATVTAFAMLGSAGPLGGWPEYFPWALPMLIVAGHPHNTAAALWIGAALGIVVSLAGCINFCRREIT
jgi:hypothetical protein